MRNLENPLPARAFSPVNRSISEHTSTDSRYQAILNLRLAAWTFFICTVIISTAWARGPKIHHFGPTGIMGSLSNQTINVTSVEKGSPADGKIKKGDVIISIGGEKFKGNLRKEFATFIISAEAEDGKLSLMLSGNRNVDLQLEVLGQYSDSSPYNCPKTEKIISRAAEYLVKNQKWASLRMDLLGLLATGEKKYIDVVKDVIHSDKNNTRDKWTQPDPEKMEKVLLGEADAGYVTWGWGYPLILLSEYFLLTKDEYVLPAIRNYAVTLARGQDAGGIWGHRMISETRNGRLPGYAQINQPSLTVFMGLLLAKKCGIKDERLDKGIQKTYAFYSTFIGRGTFNYGVHGPNTRSWNNNGTSATGALDMALMGNKEGASFFSKMAATSYDGIETGHTGHFFNVMWTPLGAHLSGPEVTKQFSKKLRWLNTLYRAWDGRFTFDGGEYKRCSSTGSALLAHCLPRRALYITGKDADQSLWLNEKDSREAVEASQIDYKEKTTSELIELINHPMPQVRRGAGWIAREKREEILPLLDKLLAEGSSREKSFALEFHGWPQEKSLSLPYIDKAGAILKDSKEDPWVRASAASMLAYASDTGTKSYPGGKYYMDIVNFINENRPWDAFQDVEMSAGASLTSLCDDAFAADLITDKEAFYQASIKLLKHKRQHTRTHGAKMLRGMPLEDFHRVAEHLVHVIEDKDRSYHSYHSPGGPVGGCVAILAQLNIKEGIDLALGILNIKSGKGSFKLRAVMDALAAYGANAKETLENFKKDDAWKGVPTNRKLRGNWNKMVKAIESDKEAVPLITLKEAIAAGKK